MFFAILHHAILPISADFLLRKCPNIIRSTIDYVNCSFWYVFSQVDAEIIGGLMIDVDDKFADLSVRTALFDEHYRRSLA